MPCLLPGVWLALSFAVSPFAPPPVPLRIAAASDLRFALDEILVRFKADNPGVTAEATYGSSGNFFAQIREGAPYDLFLSADGDYVRRLVTAGQAEYIVPLASAGVAAGVDGVFLEVHEEPTRAKSDAQNALRLDLLESLLQRLTAIDVIAKQTEARLHG